MYVQELGQKETQGSGSPGPVLTHRPGSLPGASGSAGSGAAAARHLGTVGPLPSLGRSCAGRGSAGSGLGCCSLGSTVQGWAAWLWWSQCLGARGLWGWGCASGCPCSLLPVPCAGQDPASLKGGAGWPDLGAADVTSAMSTCREGRERCPGMNLLPGTRGCWCCTPHCSRGGSRDRGGGMGLAQEAPAPQGRGAAVPAVAAARARATGGGRRAGTCWFYGLSRDVFMAGMGRLWMLPSPALGTTAGPCSASWC